MGAGLTLGTLAVLGWVLDLVPALPPAMLKLVIYKLVFLGALGLIGFGALLGRLAHRLSAESGASALGSPEPRALREPHSAAESNDPAVVRDRARTRLPER
jgi:hypothetical protein